MTYIQVLVSSIMSSKLELRVGLKGYVYINKTAFLRNVILTLKPLCYGFVIWSKDYFIILNIL